MVSSPDRQTALRDQISRHTGDPSSMSYAPLAFKLPRATPRSPFEAKTTTHLPANLYRPQPYQHKLGSGELRERIPSSSCILPEFGERSA